MQPSTRRFESTLCCWKAVWRCQFHFSDRTQHVPTVPKLLLMVCWPCFSKNSAAEEPTIKCWVYNWTYVSDILLCYVINLFFDCFLAMCNLCIGYVKVSPYFLWFEQKKKKNMLHFYAPVQYDRIQFWGKPIFPNLNFDSSPYDARHQLPPKFPLTVVLKALVFLFTWKGGFCFQCCLSASPDWPKNQG